MSTPKKTKRINNDLDFLKLSTGTLNKKKSKYNKVKSRFKEINYSTKKDTSITNNNKYKDISMLRYHQVDLEAKNKEAFDKKLFAPSSSMSLGIEKFKLKPEYNKINWSKHRSSRVKLSNAQSLTPVRKCGKDILDDHKKEISHDQNGEKSVIKFKKSLLKTPTITKNFLTNVRYNYNASTLSGCYSILNNKERKFISNNRAFSVVSEALLTKRAESKISGKEIIFRNINNAKRSILKNFKENQPRDSSCFKGHRRSWCTPKSLLLLADPKLGSKKIYFDLSSESPDPISHKYLNIKQEIAPIDKKMLGNIVSKKKILSKQRLKIRPLNITLNSPAGR